MYYLGYFKFQLVAFLIRVLDLFGDFLRNLDLLEECSEFWAEFYYKLLIDVVDVLDLVDLTTRPLSLSLIHI